MAVAEPPRAYGPRGPATAKGGGAHPVRPPWLRPWRRPAKNKRGPSRTQGGPSLPIRLPVEGISIRPVNDRVTGGLHHPPPPVPARIKLQGPCPSGSATHENNRFGDSNEVQTSEICTHDFSSITYFSFDAHFRV